MNAVIYARYSSDSQREESIEGQLRECREYAERNNMTIVGTYIDRALSAKTADRPEFQYMIKDSAKEQFEIVLVWKLDRFSRDRYDSAHYKHILKKNDVKVVSAKEHISEGPEGIILEAMLEGYAEFYSAELSEKIHRGQKENALKGKNNGDGVPLGYLLDKKAQKLVIDPTTAPLVVEIFEKYADGKTVRSIVEDFNARGLRTKKGQPFNINSFSSLLKNRKYIGEYRYQDVVIEGGVPAIVPEDLFNRVQERMEKNRHAPAMAKAKEDYLLTTKLFCGKCERMMVGESGKSHTGAMHYYYKCSGAKRLKDCDKKAVRKDWIERVVVHLTMQRVMDEEKINRLIDAILVMQEQEDTTTPALRSQLAETESSIGNILKAIEQGIFTPSTKQRLDELEARKEEILVNIQTAELQKPKLTREQMTAWFEQFRHGDPANRDFQKRLIDTFVNAVYVFDDKLVLTYNYQHGTQTISLEEIESALSSDFDGATPPNLIGFLIQFHQEPYRFLCSVFSLFAYTFFEAKGALHSRFGGFLSLQNRFFRSFRKLFRKAIVSFSDYRFTIASGIEKARSSALRAMLFSNVFRYSRAVFEQKLSSSVRVDRELLDEGVPQLAAELDRQLLHCGQVGNEPVEDYDFLFPLFELSVELVEPFGKGVVLFDVLLVSAVELALVHRRHRVLLYERRG